MGQVERQVRGLRQIRIRRCTTSSSQLSTPDMLQLRKWLILVPYPSLPHLSFRIARSSRAVLRLMPHLDLTKSATSFCCSCFSLAMPSVTMLTKILEQLNFLASFKALHSSGSSLRKRLISSMSSPFKWYRGAPIFRIGGGNSEGGEGELTDELGSAGAAA